MRNLYKYRYLFRWEINRFHGYEDGNIRITWRAGFTTESKINRSHLSFSQRAHSTRAKAAGMPRGYTCLSFSLSRIYRYCHKFIHNIHSTKYRGNTHCVYFVAMNKEAESLHHINILCNSLAKLGQLLLHFKMRLLNCKRNLIAMKISISF